jgi:hypothetical protein
VPRRCTVCTDETRPLVESGLALGESAASLAARTGLTEDSIRRHAKRHLRQPAANGGDLEQQLNDWLAKIERLYNAAGSSGDVRAQIECHKSAMNILSQRQALADERIKRESAQKQAANQGLTLADLDLMVRAAESHLDYSRKCSGCGRLGVPHAVV